MKKVILLLMMALWMPKISAQELTVVYQAVYNTASPQLFAETGLNEDMRSGLAAAYKNVVMNYQLTLHNDESEFRLVPGEGKQEITFMGQTIDVNAVSMAQVENYTYKNHTEGIVLDKTQVLGKNFIVADSIQTTRFLVVDGEKKDILGFDCQKAVSPDGKTTVWFTSNIPVKDEPIVCGLEGLILQLDNGTQIFTAVDISDTADKKVVRPTGEKVVSRDEFTDWVNKRVEMMKRN